MKYIFKTEATHYWPEINVIATLEVINADTSEVVHRQELALPWRVTKELAEKMLLAAKKAEYDEQEYIDHLNKSGETL